MNEAGSTTLDNWGKFLLERVLHPLTVFGTPAFLLVLIVYFVTGAFRVGPYDGVRSVAAFLLPMIVSSYIFAFQNDLFKLLGKVNIVVSFFSSLIWGIIVMAITAVIGAVSEKTMGIPICEIVLSGSFSLLLFGYVGLQKSAALVYFYGTVSGLLVWIILFGFPIRFQ